MKVLSCWRHLSFTSNLHAEAVPTRVSPLSLKRTRLGVIFAFLAAVVWVTGCGSSQSSSGKPAASNAAGDIADTATYLTYHGPGFTVKYVEGWTIQQGSRSVRISDKDSSEVVVVSKSRGATGTTFASTDLHALSGSQPRFHLLQQNKMRLPAGPALHAHYRALSPPDPVTGKQVPILVDRYYISAATRRAVITLSTPLTVDNVDAFRLIAHSFRWK